MRSAEGVAEAIGEPFGGEGHYEGDAVALGSVGGSELVVQQVKIGEFGGESGDEGRDVGSGGSACDELVEGGGEFAGPGEDSAGGEFVGAAAGFIFVCIVGCGGFFGAAFGGGGVFLFDEADVVGPAESAAEGAAGEPCEQGGVFVVEAGADERGDDDLIGKFVEGGELGAGADGGEEFAGACGDEDEVAFERRFFESFKQGILGGGFHEVGFVDDEEFALAAEGAFINFGFFVLCGVAGDFAADDIDGEGCAFGFTALVVIADKFLGDDVQVGVITGFDSAAGFAALAGQREEKVGRQLRNRIPIGRLDGMIAKDSFGKFNGKFEFSDAKGTGENPRAGEATGADGALELRDGARLGLDGEHREKNSRGNRKSKSWKE